MLNGCQIIQQNFQQQKRKNYAEICEVREWMWHQDIPGYSGMFPCPQTNEQYGRDQLHSPIIFQGYFLDWIKIMIIIFLPSLLTSSISKILLARESAVSLKGKMTKNKKQNTENKLQKSHNQNVLKIPIACRIMKRMSMSNKVP